MRFTLAFACALVPAAAHAADPKPTAAQLEHFEAKVRPVLAEHCYSCHGPKKQSAGLRLDTAAGIRAGADNGPVLVPGDPAKSRLIKSVRREGDYAMPPKAPLPADAVAVLSEWVKAGAVMPDDIAQGPTTDPRKHWAFQPVKEPQVPAGAAHPIDALVSAKLRDKGLSLAPRADKRALARRAYYDLTGLPPTAEQLDAFERDNSPDAWEKLIDQLLASPQYGERWGRYWLDIARYADTKGYVFQEERAFAFSYTYRDYVIKAFNDDKPYDRFVTEQLAADLLPETKKQPEALAAMGFLTLGRRFLSNQQDIIDDRIDVVTRGFMGLTVTCARCHDHKYDPVPTKDYYSLYGVFASTREPADLPLIGEVKRTPEVIAFERDVAQREAAFEAERAKRHGAAVGKLRAPLGVGDYLRAAFELRGKPNEELQNALRQRDLNRFVFDRWRDFVAAQVRAKSNVFVPLQALAAVPEKEFAEKWAAALPKETNAPLRKALEGAKPKALRDALDAAAKLLTSPPAVGPLSPAQEDLFAWRAAGGPTDVPLADADKIFNRADRDALAAVRKKIDAFKAGNPHAPPRAHVIYDNPQPAQPVVFLRGNPNNRGPAVPRQAPEIVSPNRKPFTEGSGRLELARSITSAENPLTARVFVNRVWLGHFGHGLVRTPSDFGVRSDPPVHPELLDWLASTFVKDGWSVKRLHKRIMLSATYQQSSATSEAAYKLDPENQLLARQNRRRLDFEALRDALLFASGTLDLTPGGKPVDLFKAPFTGRRTVYGLIDRTNLSSVFRAFDAANPDTHSPQRFQTTVPQQALFLMNGPFVQERAKALAARATGTPAERVSALYRLALGRAPTKAEAELALAFVSDNDARAAFGRWPQLAQVLLLSNEFAFVD